MSTYGFMDCQCSLTSDDAVIDLGYGAAVADEKRNSIFTQMTVDGLDHTEKLSGTAFFPGQRLHELLFCF